MLRQSEAQPHAPPAHRRADGGCVSQRAAVGRARAGAGAGSRRGREGGREREEGVGRLVLGLAITPGGYAWRLRLAATLGGYAQVSQDVA